MNAFFQELFHVGVYKRSQGRVARQVTLGALAVCAALGFWRLHDVMAADSTGLSIGLPFVLTLACWWISFRVINVPRFADFLIAVEAEMAKVSWPNRAELFRSSVVVLVTIFALAGILAGYDLFWNWFFRSVLGIL